MGGLAAAFSVLGAGASDGSAWSADGVWERVPSVVPGTKRVHAWNAAPCDCGGGMREGGESSSHFPFGWIVDLQMFTDVVRRVEQITREGAIARSFAEFLEMRWMISRLPVFVSEKKRDDVKDQPQEM